MPFGMRIASCIALCTAVNACAHAEECEVREHKCPGVLSYVVGQRTKELGIRMALGAQRGAVLKLVLRQGAVIVAVGVAAGVAGAAALTRYLAAMLYDLNALDVTTFTVVAALFAAVAMVAAYLPARRATAIDPLSALRYE